MRFMIKLIIITQASHSHIRVPHVFFLCSCLLFLVPQAVRGAEDLCFWTSGTLSFSTNRKLTDRSVFTVNPLFRYLRTIATIKRPVRLHFPTPPLPTLEKKKRKKTPSQKKISRFLARTKTASKISKNPKIVSENSNQSILAKSPIFRFSATIRSANQLFRPLWFDPIFSLSIRFCNHSWASAQILKFLASLCFFRRSDPGHVLLELSRSNRSAMSDFSQKGYLFRNFCNDSDIFLVYFIEFWFFFFFFNFAKIWFRYRNCEMLSICLSELMSELC